MNRKALLNRLEITEILPKRQPFEHSIWLKDILLGSADILLLSEDILLGQADTGLWPEDILLGSADILLWAFGGMMRRIAD